VVVNEQGKKKTNQTTLKSEWRSTLKKSLKRPVWLEMSGYPTTGSYDTFTELSGGLRTQPEKHLCLRVFCGQGSNHCGASG